MIPMYPVVREATESDVEQLAPLFIRSVDTSLPGVTFSNDIEGESSKPFMHGNDSALIRVC